MFLHDNILGHLRATEKVATNRSDWFHARIEAAESTTPDMIVFHRRGSRVLLRCRRTASLGVGVSEAWSLKCRNPHLGMLARHRGTTVYKT